MSCYKATQVPYIGHAQFYISPSYRHYNGAKDDYAAPSTDVLESKNAYKVRVSLPGLSKEAISIKFSENILTILTTKYSESSSDWEKINNTNEENEGSLEGAEEHEEPHKAKEFKPLATQIPTKQYKKTIEFLEKVNEEEIIANYQDGLLTLVLGKAPKNRKTINLV